MKSHFQVAASDLDVPRHLLTLKPVEALLMLLELAALEGHLIQVTALFCPPPP